MYWAGMSTILFGLWTPCGRSGLLLWTMRGH